MSKFLCKFFGSCLIDIYANDYQSMVCPTLLICHSKYSAVSLIGLMVPATFSQPVGFERWEQCIIDTINKKKPQRKVRNSLKLISSCLSESLRSKKRKGAGRY